ncbi:MAG: hypothetical protein RIT28_89 [Pseudomonadota bacterium]|jgi:hypothetical protein
MIASPASPPARRLTLTRQSFPDAPQIGLGEQLARLVAAVHAVRPELVWHFADVDAQGGPFPKVPSKTPETLGEGTLLMLSALKVQRFRSAVFVGVPPEVEAPRFRPGGLFADDLDLSDLGDAIVEIRVLDTAIITVTSPEGQLVEPLQEVFGGTLTSAP